MAVVLRLRGHRALADHWEPCPLNNGPALAAASPSSAASISSLERLTYVPEMRARPAIPALVEAGRSSHCTTTRGLGGRPLSATVGHVGRIASRPILPSG